MSTDRKFEMCEILDVIGISRGSTASNVDNSILMKKFSAEQVGVCSQLITNLIICQLRRDLWHFLPQFGRFLRRSLNVNEIWMTTKHLAPNRWSFGFLLLIRLLGRTWWTCQSINSLLPLFGCSGLNLHQLPLIQNNNQQRKIYEYKKKDQEECTLPTRKCKSAHVHSNYAGI